MNILDRAKAKADKAANDALIAVNDFSDHLDEHPSSIYWGLCGMGFTIGLMLGGIAKSLNEIKESLDE